MRTEFNYFLPIYNNLEEEVIDLSKYIQINDDQVGVYSTHIADLIVRCAMEIEAISKELYRVHSGPKTYDDKGAERDPFFDTDCINYLNNIWNICEKEIIISSDRFFLQKDDLIHIRPMYKAHKRKGAKWNKAYQAVKHDRKESIKQGNVENLLHALGALYILNLYYLDSNVDLGVTNTSKSFDARMGSSIFAASTLDTTVNIRFGAETGASILIDDIMEKRKKAIYIIRYKGDALERINNALVEDNKRLLEAIKKSPNIEAYIIEHEGELSSDNPKHIIAIAADVLGTDYIRTHNSFYDFNRELSCAEKEAILNKNEVIY